jgi:glycosyltransferase involved in cell wall biosynthesis
MEKPLVSIITPSYNQGEFIEDTIRSVINQTYTNIEYIIMDAKSTDSTIKILEKYKDKSNIKIVIEKDKGQSDAINKGFKLASGEIIGWINSDDVLKLDCVENIVNAFNNNKAAAIVYGDIEHIDEQGNFIKRVIPRELTYDSLLNVHPDVVQPGSFYKGDYVREVGYLDENIHFAMDYDLWLRLLKKGKAIRLNAVLAEFRLQSNSKTVGSGNWKKFWRDIFDVRKSKHKPKLISRLNFYFIIWMFKAALYKVNKSR